MKKIITLILTLLITLVLSACNNGDITFTLQGETQVNYTLNEEYEESGFVALEGNTDLSEYVTITHTIDTEVAADYLVTYSLDYNGQTKILQRKIMYREDGCLVINDTGTTQCTVNYSQYLHTYIKLSIFYEGDEYNNQSKTIFENVENIISDYHNLSDKYELYDGFINVKTINDNPTQTHTIDERLFDMIQFTLDHQDEVNNLFNLALGPVLQVWHDYRELADPFSNAALEIPAMSLLNEMNQYTDSSKIVLDDENYTITMEENMSIDLGGMSKGYISNILVGYLDSLNLSAYLLNNGNSNISIGGTHPIRDHGKFILAATDPSGQKYPGYATILLGDGDQLVTSGDYQQYFTVDGELYHHIINPNTLMPERYSRSVSIVVNGDAGLADLYSTAIFTMSIEDGIEFVNNTNDLEAIWYGLDGTIHYSANFEELYLGDIIE
ncbi:Thiamine biosynthesis lipoprotein ApbE precursor [Candidatus Izimaplasma bacterium HR1]|uniref:FAD:protein FMN transferase n=1 Tax=Candidatus Izimoplasma sp. HR1 TaxID=1541959 RepID=UPI0004F7311A|nr:Thiamine biosynthesis lipoprotein ApbE precursor [Candidatus Izimaplasma bacterium HR1]